MRAMKRFACIVMFVALAACAKKKADEVGTGSGSTVVVATDPSGPATGTGTGSGSPIPVPASVDAAVAVGSGSAVAAGSGSGSATAGAEDGKSAFDKLSDHEKAEFMKTKVVPPMKEAFQKFDPKAFANFGCKTCHGKDPKATKFKMPNPELPKLDFAALENGKQKPKMAEFMGKVVKPQMAEILGDKEFDPKNPKAGGFGCLDCHEQKK